ncbi:MAG: hypothetical protein P4N41_06430 [Negativicutes bacterium]|nr:hypothetical protein [Negativicutes bacterium]
MEFNIDQITHIKEITENEWEVNSYLEVGWKLLHVFSSPFAKQGDVAHYIIGWPKQSKPKTPKEPDVAIKFAPK